MALSSRTGKRHAHMVDDPLRTGPLVRAVAKSVKPGDVVLDIGTGLGLLAIAAAKAGAKLVWAVDFDSEALDEAKLNARREGVSDKIAFVNGLSFDLDLAARADIAICETVGSFAFDENILATLADAKKRLLKRGGRIIPERLELWGAPCCRLPKIDRPADIASVKGMDLMGPPSRIVAVDFQKKIPESIQVEHEFRCERSGAVRVFAVWPRTTWGRGEATDSSPLVAPTHWKQGILPVEMRQVTQGDSAGLELIIKPHPDDPLKMTERLWRWVD
ncbi:MAG: 50S ribosomal protein L11 methyltransferase [Pseudomonadota bacterium]